MKSLSVAEVEQIQLSFFNLIGAKVQNIFYKANGYLLELWSPLLQKQYIIFDTHKIVPFCFNFSFKPTLEREGFKSPVGLFSRRHLKGRRLVSVSMPDVARPILLFNFESFLIEFSLIPHKVNLKVSYDDKALHWYKVVKPLLKGESFRSSEVRSLETLGEQWLSLKKGLVEKKINTNKSNELIQFFKAKIKKTKRAILKNEEGIKRREGEANSAKRIALFLQAGRKLSVLSSLDMESIKENKSWAWNMDDQFTQCKKLTFKLSQTQVRQEVLEKEMSVLVELSKEKFLQNLDISVNLTLLKKSKVTQIPHFLLGGEPSYEEAFKKGVFKKILKSNVKNSTAKSDSLFPGVAKRSLLLGSGVMAVAGKNAKANVDLLRQARPWYIWVHLRNYPSSHAIILSAKSQVIKDKEIIGVGNWLVQMSSKKLNLSDIKIDLIYTQCRFVKSIKGDSLGRVSYKNEKSILL